MAFKLSVKVVDNKRSRQLKLECLTSHSHSILKAKDHHQHPRIARGTRLIPVSRTIRNIIHSRLVSYMPASANKVARVMPSIGTHNGTFHCDEALACFMLKLLPEYTDAEVIRSRDPVILEKCDVVVDVGGVYDPSKHRYDHHQRSFNETMKSLGSGPWEIKLSSAGLVYLHFGKKILSKLLNLEEGAKIVHKLFNKIYENLIIEIDAIDNGVNMFDGEPRYTISTNLSSRVGDLNPPWNEPNPKPDELFVKAQELVGAAFLDKVNYYKNSWLPARVLVEEAVDKRFEVDSSGEILAFTTGGCPWKDHLFDIEEEKNLQPIIKFVLFADQNGAWRVQCVPVRPKCFDNRLSLLEEWRGVRDEALSSLSGIPQCIFVHASGFIGGNKTYNGALEMAQRTLQARTKTES